MIVQDIHFQRLMEGIRLMKKYSAYDAIEAEEDLRWLYEFALQHQSCKEAE